MHIVILDKYEVPLEIAVLAQMNDMLNVFFAVVIPRVRFAGKDELNRSGGIAGELHDIVELLENQGGAFVSCESACKTDRQRIGVEQLIEGDEIPLRQPLTLDKQSTPGKFDELTPQFIAQRPKFLIRDK